MEHIHVFLARNVFIIEIKKCACTTSKIFSSIETFPEWNTALKFPYDANMVENDEIKSSIISVKLLVLFTLYFKTSRCYYLEFVLCFTFQSCPIFLDAKIALRILHTEILR